MQIESSKSSKEKDFSKSLKIGKKNIICKDGFCTLPTQNENTNIIENNVNLFDPIQFKKTYIFNKNSKRISSKKFISLIIK